MGNVTPITKSDRVEIGISKWVANKGVGTLNWVMQFGKTRAGCLIASRTFAKHQSTIFIIVPSQVVKKQWLSTLEEYTSLLDYPNHVFIYTIGEFNNLDIKETTVNLLIIDEVHRFTSLINKTIFTKVNYKFILGLTGTYPNIGQDKRLLDKYCPVVDTITEIEALANGWIAPFREYNVLLQLPDVDKRRYALFSEPIRSILTIFKNSYREFKIGNTNTFLFTSDYDVIQGCYSGKSVKDIYGRAYYFTSDDIRRTLATKKGWHQQLDLTSDLNNQIDEYWNPSAIKANATKFIDAVRKRNEILINHPVKLNAVLEIFKMNPVNTICFNESTDFADAIAETFNNTLYQQGYRAVVYHSNITSRTLIDPETGTPYLNSRGEPKVFGKTKLRNLALAGLAGGTFQLLVTAKALDEGVSIPELRQVITTAGTTNPTQYKQRSARGKTIDVYDVNKITNIFNLCFDDYIMYDSDGNSTAVHSRDLQKLKLRQADAAIKPIEVNGLDELKSLLIP